MTEDNDLVIENLKRVESIFGEIFGDRLSGLAKADARRVVVSRILDNEEQFFEKDPDTALAKLIKDTWNSSQNNFLLFLRTLRAGKGQIQAFESELSKAVLHELKRTEAVFGSDDSFSKLINLYFNIITHPEKSYIIAYIKTPPHRKDLQNAINSIKNEKIAKYITETIIALTNEEIDYLMKYLNEISSWDSRESITEDLQFFTAKVSSFLYGRGEQYPGLFAYFKDEKLEQMIKSNPAYIQFSRYNVQLLYLRRLRERISTYKTGDWTQFEEVYNSIRKIADNFVTKFGNTEIASELFAEKKEIREYPERWLQDIDNKIADIDSAQYRKTKVISPFIKELERIFSLRINELRIMAKPEVEELKNAIKPLIKLERDSAKNIMGSLRRFRKKMKKKLEKLRKDFDAISNRCIDSLTDFVSAKIQLINDEITTQILSHLRSAQTSVRGEKQFVENILRLSGTDLETTSRDPRVLLALLYDLDKASRASLGASQNLQSIGFMFSNKDILSRLNDLNDTLKAAENAYRELGEFILTKLGFMVQSSEVRREDYGRTTTAA
ncbi:hypothetical protein HYX08_06570 [Candidatus Woesearchaeota archaeon]|nr:hypothetical protein [Candidatus Woesearchaeota archaeon]